MSERERRMRGEAARGAGGKDAREEQMRAVLAAAYPAREPSEALRERVAELAARHDAREAGIARRAARRWAPLRIALGLAAATVLAFVLVGLAPTWTAAQVLRRAEAAIEGVRNAHTVTWRVAVDGSRRKAGESWYQGELYRSEDALSGRVQVFAGGRLWTYEPKLNKVTRRTQPGPGGYNASGFSIGAMARDFTRWGWRDRIRVLGDATVDGRLARRVAVERAGEPVRVLLEVDAATDLPMQSEVQFAKDAEWETQLISEHHYNEPLPARLFQLEFPKTAQVFDRDTDRRDWEQRLSKGIARQRVADRAIIVRDLQVNADGDVFLLYTAGRSLDDNRIGRDWRVELQDELGTVYLWAPLETSMAKLPPGVPNGFVFNGEKIEGDWWVPAVPQNPWKPRRFTVTFRGTPAAVRGELHHPPSEQRRSEAITFKLPVKRPAAVMMPDYMAYMWAGGPLEWQMASERAGRRGDYYRHKVGKMPQALKEYRERARIVEEASRESGQPIHQPENWLAVGAVLRTLQRNEEARRAYEQALREATYDSTRGEARKALEAVKADLAAPGK